MKKLTHESSYTWQICPVMDFTSSEGKMNSQDLQVAFGKGNNVRHIPVLEIVASIEPSKSHDLPMFHAYTGHGTVSSFAIKGKTA